MSIAGVDGCKNGWIMIKWNLEDYAFGVYNTIAEMVLHNSDINRILIDIPIGLSSKNVRRTVESEVRKNLNIDIPRFLIDPAEKLCTRIMIIRQERET